MNRTKKIIAASAIIVILLLAACLAWHSPAPKPTDGYAHTTVTLDGKTFDAQIADTDALREQGLSGRDGLSPNQAMLFVFDAPDTVGFWMKDMKFSLDMLWLDSDMRVVSFAKDATPESYPKIFFPSGLSRYVIEFPAGTLDSLGVKAGDQADIVR